MSRCTFEKRIFSVYRNNCFEDKVSFKKKRVTLKEYVPANHVKKAYTVRVINICAVTERDGFVTVERVCYLCVRLTLIIYTKAVL